MLLDINMPEMNGFQVLEQMNRFRWIDEIDDAGLAERLKTLTPEEVELVTLYAYDRFTQEEIGRMLGISQMAVSKRIGKVRKKLGKRF